jgi:hypothetical protein
LSIFKRKRAGLLLLSSIFEFRALGFNVSQFFIAGNVAFEVQYAVTATVPSNVILSTYGIGEFGNLVTEQRVLQSELTTIPAVSPIIP